MGEAGDWLRASSLEDNIAYLVDRFVERLLDERPASVLDVGCGSGRLLARLADARVPAVGAEPDAADVAKARAAGHACVRSDATRLPFADGAFDWVTMRHVPHHLEDPAAAFAEATRVCRRGLVLAEPWFGEDLPGHAAALAADRWLKRQHRRAGMVHHEVLDLRQLRHAMPPDVDFVATAEVAVRLARRPLEHLANEAAPLLAALDPADPDLDAGRRMLESAGRDGITWNGSLIATFRRAADDA